jgi:hypothetical protein
MPPKLRVGDDAPFGAEGLDEVGAGGLVEPPPLPLHLEQVPLVEPGGLVWVKVGVVVGGFDCVGCPVPVVSMDVLRVGRLGCTELELAVKVGVHTAMSSVNVDWA